MKRIPLRIQFLVIAFSLAVTTCVLGLSAYLTDEDTYQSTFHTAAGDELGFEITGTEYDDETILPGDTIPLNVVATISEPNDLFIFVQIDISSEFTINGFNQSIWHSIEEGSNIYYYGLNSTLIALGTENGSSAKIFDSVTLPTNVREGQDFYVSVTGYAIQSTNIPKDAAPADVFSMIGGN